MKKRISALLCAAVTAAFLSGCSGETESSKGGSSSPEESSQVVQTTTAPPITTVSAIETTVSEVVVGDSTKPTEISEDRRQIVSTAQALIGIPYNYGCADPHDGFDNSGFIYYVLRENGYINCPRTTEAQMEMGTKITIDKINPGDILFFSDDGSLDTVFSGIYVGEDMIIYSSSPGGCVKTADISIDYWQNAFKWAISVS